MLLVALKLNRKLKERCDIPVFHDDQHGTAVVVLSGIRNALKLTGKKPEECSVVMSGAGAAGTAIAKLLLTAGFKDITMRNIDGVISSEKTYDDPSLTELASLTNPNHKDGSLADIIKGADIFIGVSAPGLLTEEMIKTMNKDAIIFAMLTLFQKLCLKLLLLPVLELLQLVEVTIQTRLTIVNLPFPGNLQRLL